MKTKCNSIAALAFAVLSFGLVASIIAEDDLQPPKLSELNKLRKLPDHWRCFAGPSIDTEGGWFGSSEVKTHVSYGIWYQGGEKAEQARPENHKDFKWHRTGRIGDANFSYLLTKDNQLLITFPDEGPANYYAFVKTSEEIAYVVELVGRHRHRLRAKKEKLTYPSPPAKTAPAKGG